MITKILIAVCLMLSWAGCAHDSISYRKSCWEIALGAAAGARYELGLDKVDIRIATGYHRANASRHAWTEVFVKGRWVRIGDCGQWFCESQWQYIWVPSKYYTFDQAFDRAKRFKPRR